MGIKDTLRQAMHKVEDMIGNDTHDHNHEHAHDHDHDHGHDHDHDHDHEHEHVAEQGDATATTTPSPMTSPPQPEVHPSSTPDGPQTIPSPSTPEGEPGPDPAEEARASDPNAASPLGLAGDLGVSSERLPDEPDSIEGTGSRGTSTSTTNGHWPVSGKGSVYDEDAGPPSAADIQAVESSGTTMTETPDSPHTQDPAEGAEPDAADPGDVPQRHAQEPAEGPEMDDRQQSVTQEWREGQPAANVAPAPDAGVDGTVGEVNSAEVKKHAFDPTKNPGHSHS